MRFFTLITCFTTVLVAAPITSPKFAEDVKRDPQSKLPEIVKIVGDLEPVVLPLIAAAKVKRDDQFEKRGLSSADGPVTHLKRDPQSDAFKKFIATLPEEIEPVVLPLIAAAKAKRDDHLEMREPSSVDGSATNVKRDPATYDDIFDAIKTLQPVLPPVVSVLSARDVGPEKREAEPQTVNERIAIINGVRTPVKNFLAALVPPARRDLLDKRQASNTTIDQVVSALIALDLSIIQAAVPT